MADNRNVYYDRCPTPEKQAYPDPRLAAAALGHKRTNGTVVYRCPTKPAHWHLGRTRGHPRTWGKSKPRRMRGKRR